MRGLAYRLIRAQAGMLLLVMAAVAGPSVAAVAGGLEIPAELWDRPRSGRTVMAVPAVRQAIAALLDRADARLQIRHPPGAETTLQAEELRAWLVAHAVEPRRIQLRPDLQAREPLRLEIVN